MPLRRPGLWVDVALALALITVATVLLNAGAFWLVLRGAEERRRTDLALSLSTALAAQLEVEAAGDAPEAGYRRVMAIYKDAGLDVDELYVADARMRTLASVAGAAPRVPDEGLRAALYGRSQHVEIDGFALGRRAVVVTSPIAPRGRPVAALRVRVPLRPPPVPGGFAGFVLAYTGVSGLAVAVWGYALLRRRLLAPVAAIRRGTAAIASGQFGHVVVVDAARELQELCADLNTMSAWLEGYRRRMAEQVERLERANRELAQAHDALVRSERLATVGRLAAGLAHEVGNPLAAVLGYLELMEQGLGDPALERDLVRRSRRELERIHRTIRQLLDLSRPGTGRADDVDVRAALVEAAETTEHQPAFREVRLVVDCPQGLPAVRVERDKLHQALVNLLLNAADAMGGRGEVRLSARVAGDEVEVRCEDTGPGFSAEALRRAFEPFFTTKEPGRGTGLGLATVQQVVEGAGGRVDIGNRDEGGAWVRIRLPAAPAPG